jgi:antagonist of KipI
MAIKIIKKGIADSLQDQGRYGYQHQGIQPNGCMDYLSAWLGNAIVQNDLHHPIIELHFPAAQIQFTTNHTICITGANFVPVLNEKSIPMNTPIQVNAMDRLTMLQPLEGKTCYVAIKGDFEKPQWLDSQSFNGKRFEKEEQILILDQSDQINPNFKFNPLVIEKVHHFLFNNHDPIRIIPGPAWQDLTEDSIHHLLNAPYSITPQANRMGFQLAGPALSLTSPNNYLSSAVTRGTIQLLPNGELIVLMADHQTIGGYANLGQIILVDLPRFAQIKTEHLIKFSLTKLATAHNLYQEMYAQFKH